MRFAPPPHEAGDDHLNVTAMVDVVFILLAFFVLSATFVGVERDLAVEDARRAAAGQASGRDLPESIEVRAASTTDGAVRLVVGRAELGVNAFDGLTAMLGTINAPRVPVVVAADPALTVDQVARVLDAVAASPMKDVSLIALE